MGTFILVLLIYIGPIVLSLEDIWQKLFLSFCDSAELQKPITFFVVEIYNRALEPCCVCHNVIIPVRFLSFFSKQSFGHFMFAHGRALEKCCQIVPYGKKCEGF